MTTTNDAPAPRLRYYGQLISDATGIVDYDTLCAIEEGMRDETSNGCLDGFRDLAEFNAVARKVATEMGLLA